MTLSEFKALKGLSLTGLAEVLQKPVTTVHGWLAARRRPGWDDVALIEERTDGLVTANDFVPRRQPEVASCA